MAHVTEELFHFVELEPPTPVGSGSDKWLVRAAADTGYVYCLSTNGTSVFPPMTVNNRVNYFFDSEADAHRVACFYYSYHGLLYPYMASWQPLAAANDVQSETMEFI